MITIPNEFTNQNSNRPTLDYQRTSIALTQYDAKEEMTKLTTNRKVADCHWPSSDTLRSQITSFKSTLTSTFGTRSRWRAPRKNTGGRRFPSSA
jgi:hypothetical protein